MKKILTTAILLFFGFCAMSNPPMRESLENNSAISSPKAVVWAGLDYSLVRMIGGDEFEYGFNVPDLIFPGMFEKWNQLFLDERLERVAHSLGKRVLVDLGGVTARNQTANANQITLITGAKDTIKESHITPEVIASEVQSYQMKNTNGLGMVFIVDRLVYRVRLNKNLGNNTHIPTVGAGGAVYVVFFDVATRQVISAKREVHGVSTGGNFRNFWFGPIKDTDANLTKYR